MNRPAHRRSFFLLAAGVLVIVIAVASIHYLNRSAHCVLYYYGASPEVPQGRAIAVLNPLRNRKDEANAEWLIRDLRTGKCEGIALDRLAVNPTRTCQVMRRYSKASLIWLDPESDTTKGGSRRLVYDLPDRKARLTVYFGADEPGWGVKTFSVVQ